MKKIILLTGATDGIGKLLAYKLAEEDNILYVHGRNEKKLKDLITDIQNKSGNRNIYSCVADFSDLDSVKLLSQKLVREITHIDILINNAGIYNSPVEKASNGFDIRFIVNYFAPFLLTKELLPLLKKSEAPRIINLSSAAQAPVSLEALDGNKELSPGEAYAQSKLALTMWSFDLARKYPHITTIAVNPGCLLNTKMANEAFGQHWSPAEKGVDILYDLAILEKYRDDSGKYYDNDRGSFGEAHSDAYDDQKVEDLRVVTEKILGKYLVENT